MQFQLTGVIHSVSQIDGAMILIFTGDLKVTGNGGSVLSNYTELRSDKWFVTELPVRIEAWGADSPVWAGRTLTFEQTVTTAKNFANNAKKVQLALKDLSIRFTEMGRVLGISCEQAVCEEAK